MNVDCWPNVFKELYILLIQCNVRAFKVLVNKTNCDELYLKQFKNVSNCGNTSEIDIKNNENENSYKEHNDIYM